MQKNLLKRTQIRQAIIAVLSDPSTPVMPDGGVGLTLAEGRILDSYLDPLQLDCGGGAVLPAIAVYTEMEELTGSDDNQFDGLCFDRSLLAVELELYACAAEGHELEALLDQMEMQVRCKLLPDARFYRLGRLRGYRSVARRSGDGRRLGRRLIQLRVEYGEAVRVEQSTAALAANIEWQAAAYVREPAPIQIINPVMGGKSCL